MNIDLLSPSSFDGGQPHAQFRWLREHDPVHWHAEPGGRGYWALTRYADIRDIGRNSAEFSSEPTIMIPDAAGGAQFGDHKMMLMMDPPRHTEYRKMISREFTQGPAASMAPRIRELARQIIDDVIERGECDFVSDVAGEMPSYVIAELLGLPLNDGRRLYELTETIHTAPETLPEGAGMRAVFEMFSYADGVIRDKRAKPGNDLASKLLAAEVDGQRLDDMDFKLFFLLLIDAGGDTTRNLVAGGLLTLLQHPDALSALRADLDRNLMAARNELLRWISPVIYMRRTANVDTRIGTTAIKAGDKVVMYYGAGNRDPNVFAHPETFDITRMPNPHIAFGGGTHVCLGQHVARVEIDALLTEVVTRLHNVELNGDVEWLASNFISGPRRMPVRFTAGKRAQA